MSLEGIKDGLLQDKARKDAVTWAKFAQAQKDLKESLESRKLES